MWKPGQLVTIKECWGNEVYRVRRIPKKWSVFTCSRCSRRQFCRILFSPCRIPGRKVSLDCYLEQLNK